MFFLSRLLRSILVRVHQLSRFFFLLQVSICFAGPKPESDQCSSKFWELLASEDPAVAYAAVIELTQHPSVSIALCKSHMAPFRVATTLLDSLVADLDSQSFAKRQFATRQLQQFGQAAEPSLRSALKKTNSLELRKRGEALLLHLEEPIRDPETLRMIRAVEVLERIGTQQAIGLLEQLATGHPAARLTLESRNSLKRLKPKARS